MRKDLELKHSICAYWEVGKETNVLKRVTQTVYLRALNERKEEMEKNNASKRLELII